jgi:hypothetical protein
MWLENLTKNCRKEFTIGLPVNLLTDKGEDTDEWALQMDTFGGFGSLT